MQKMIIEARINEYAMRDENPHVPWTPVEIADAAARCRDAGASILHYHARADDGSPLQTFDLNAEIIRRVHEKCEMLILPTLGFFSNDGDPASRIGCMLELAKDRETKPGGGGELPFGGMKASGHGREKGFEALHAFGAIKTVAIKHGA